jgi:6-phosphogluconolactonase
MFASRESRVDEGTFFFAAVGPRLTTYTIDVERAALARGTSIELPAPVQYAWQHRERNLLYVVTSNGGPGAHGSEHYAQALHMDANTGALREHGTPVALPARPIHCCLDRAGEYFFVAYNSPSGLSVHRLGDDGAIGPGIGQREGGDFGVYAHQVRVSPNNRTALLVTRGNDAKEGEAEEPGAIKVFHFLGGALDPVTSIAPSSDGLGFGPRHLDFHPTSPWVYVSVERQDELHMYALDDSDTLVAPPRYSVDSLAQDTRVANLGPQIAGAVHVHPNGQFVYQANRTDGLHRKNGSLVAQGGEDSLVVYAIEPNTGEPRIVQRVPTPTIHVRTFAIDPSGRLLIACSIRPVPTADDDGGVRLVPAAIVVYRIGDDGKLSMMRKYDVDTKDNFLFWSGMATLPIDAEPVHDDAAIRTEPKG